MKAAVFHRPGQPLAVEIVPDPAPGPGEAVIRVRYCGVCGTDLHSTENHVEGDQGLVLGHEFTGEIIALGRETPAPWREGDRLCSLPFLGCGRCLSCQQGRPWRCPTRQIVGSAEAPGGFAEYMRVHLNEAVRLPDQVSWKEGALVEPLAVALHAVRKVRGGLGGRNVLVVGAGPIGLACVLWSAFFGARQVIVSELDASRAAMAPRYGATGVIDAKGEIGAQFRDVAGAEPDLILECVGVPGMLAHCVDVAPYGGEVIVVGFCMKPDTFMPAAAMVKELTVQFVIAHDKSDFQFVVDMMAAGRIAAAPMVTDIHGFDDFPSAFEALRTPSRQCKILLAPGGD
jgi:2-desacetyl-2-hydroxyethyl bacteriochlorophyllide A dehydrogenase